MICNLFFEGKIKESDDKLIYQEDFVLFLLKLKLLEIGEFQKEDVVKILAAFYGRDKFKYNKIKDICDNNFVSNEDKYTLKPEDIESYNCIKAIKEIIFQQLKYDKNSIYESIQKDILSVNTNFNEQTVKVLILKNRGKYKEQIIINIILFKLCTIKNEYYNIYRKIEYLLEKIPSSFNKISLHRTGFDGVIVKILNSYNIFTIKDFKELKVENIIILFCDNINELYEILQKYSNDKEELINDFFQNLKELLKPQQKTVLIERRKGIEKIEYQTLEEIGGKLGVSGERIRQIEQNGKRILSKYLLGNEPIIETLYYKAKELPTKYLDLRDYYEYLNNDEIFRISLAIFELEQSTIKISIHYNILYDSRVDNIKDIIQEEREKIPNVISIDETTDYNSIQKDILLNEYRVIENNIYLKKGINLSDIYLSEIANNFSEGYTVLNDNDYNKLKDCIKSKYYIEKISSKESIRSMLDKSEFVQVDKGKYKLIKYKDILSNDLINKLELCIDNLFEKMNVKVLPVKRIYSELSILHKDIINQLNITSRFGDFELFSILQVLYKDKYFFNRPFISIEETENITKYSLIRDYLQQFEKFSYQDIKRYIQKMNIEQIYSYLNFMEELSDEYVQIDMDTMIKIDNFKISEEQLNKIDDLIELILKSNKEINTNSFDGYFMLPKLSENWNKYMLVGIIRSYFRNKYSVENTTNTYTNTDFIIRRNI